MKYLTALKFDKKCIEKEDAIKYAIIINVLMLIITFLIFTPRYETNDDIAMANFAKGAYCEKTSYLVFINFILGWVFKILYSFCDSINWYYILQCFFMLVAFTVLSYLVYITQKKSKYPVVQGTVLNVFLLILFIPITYLNFNFTKSAAVISLAGFFLLLHHMSNDHQKLHVLLFGASLVILGGMIRLDSMLMISVFPFFLVIFRLLKIQNKKISINFKLFLRYAILFIPIFLISFALSFLNVSPHLTTLKRK